MHFYNDSNFILIYNMLLTIYSPVLEVCFVSQSSFQKHSTSVTILPFDAYCHSEHMISSMVLPVLFLVGHTREDSFPPLASLPLTGVVCT